MHVMVCQLDDSWTSIHCRIVMLITFPFLHWITFADIGIVPVGFVQLQRTKNRICRLN